MPTADRQDTPAGHLSKFLRHCEGSKQNQAIITTWAAYFGTEPRLTRAFAQQYAAIADLPEQTRIAVHGRGQVEPLPGTAIYFRTLMSVEQALVEAASNNSNQIAGFVGSYERGAAVTLELLSETLADEWRGITSVDRDGLSRLVKLAGELQDLVMNDPLIDASLRLLVMDLADRIYRATRLSQMAGMDDLATQRDMLIGRLVADPGLAGQVGTHPRVLDRLKEFLTITSVIVTLFNGSIDAGQSVTAFEKAIEASRSATVQHVAPASPQAKGIKA